MVGEIVNESNNRYVFRFLFYKICNKIIIYMKSSENVCDLQYNHKVQE